MRTFRRPHPVWALNLALAMAAAFAVARVLQLPAQEHPQVPWWLLAPLFYLGEVYVVHIHVRRSAQTFSLSEIPLVLGLFFASPWQLLLGQLAGAGAELVLHRRQVPVKAAFNLTKWAIETSLAIFVFAAVSDSGHPLSPRSWLAAFLAILTVAILGPILTALAISITERSTRLIGLAEPLLVSVATAVANTSLALVAVVTVQAQPLAGLLLISPVAGLVIGYRAYLADRKRQQAVGFLNEAARLLETGSEPEESVLPLLELSLEMFRAEFAELAISAGGWMGGFRAIVGPGDKPARIDQPGSAQSTSPLELKLARLERGIRLNRLDAGDEVSDELAALDVRDAMAVALRSERNMIGFLMVANRIGAAGSFGKDELGLFESLGLQVSAAIEKARIQQRFWHHAFHDSLTNLANRSLFLDRTDHALSRRADSTTPVAVLFLDIDDFKTVNDSLGYAAGDQLLVAVAERLRECVRPCDTAARLAADEFAVLVEDVVGTEAAVEFGERIERHLARPFRLLGGEVQLRASIGVALAEQGEMRAEDLLRNADVAMFVAKADERRGVVAYESSMAQALLRRHALKADLERAIARSEFDIEYQPVVDTVSGSVEAVEALVRWRHHALGRLGPDAFIPLAEETGQVLAIGRIVLERACTEIAALRRRLPGCELAVSVNVSRPQLREAGFAADVLEIASHAGLPPTALILEITERMMMAEPADLVPRLQRLRAIGVQIAIDDFGIGYSSLSLLLDYPVDVLKIAKTFVDRVGTRASLAPAMISVGATLGLRVVAEGVEAEAQREELARLGCQQIQGFLVAAPMPANAIVDFLGRSSRVTTRPGVLAAQAR